VKVSYDASPVVTLCQFPIAVHGWPPGAAASTTPTASRMWASQTSEESEGEANVVLQNLYDFP